LGIIQGKGGRSYDGIGLMNACEILSLYSQVNQLCVT